MTLTFRRLWVAAGSLSVGVLTGCISHSETQYRTEPRRQVSFENDVAGRVFYEALSKPPKQRVNYESKTQFKLPVVLDYESREVMGENAVFNLAVERCDTNADGVITVTEAQIFAQSR